MDQKVGYASHQKRADHMNDQEEDAIRKRSSVVSAPKSYHRMSVVCNEDRRGTSLQAEIADAEACNLSPTVL